MEETNLLTKYKEKIILASSSKTRISILKKYINDFEVQPHKINESEFKIDGDPKKIVNQLAKNKALSIRQDNPDCTIIGSDQILVCDHKVLSKPKTLKEGKQNLLFLRNKNHSLFSSIFIVYNDECLYSNTTDALLFFRDVPEGEIDTYITENQETVLTTVGSYKIEENHKYDFIQIIRGDKETILGFPIKNFIRKLTI